LGFATSDFHITGKYFACAAAIGVAEHNMHACGTPEDML
jgi:hypothetical protein